MNLDTAISAHAQWKTKFRTAISAKDTMDAATIGTDNCCELGKWLYGEGRGLHSSKPAFTALIDKHKAFHIEAGNVARMVNNKNFDQASKMIDFGTPFSSASSAVGVAINGLKKALG